MRRRPIVVAALLALACAGLVVGVASAATKAEAEEVSPPGGFELRGSNGYEITVSVYLDEDTGRGQVGLTARRGHERASYVSPAKVTEDSVRADLGSLGRIDLVLHKSGRTETVKERCSRYRETFETGTYEGTFEFNGEGGFTRARATRVAGLSYLGLLDAGFDCDSQGTNTSFGPQEPGARIDGTSLAEGRDLKFQLIKNRPGGKTVYSGSLRERRDGIRISREVSGVAPAGAFRFGNSLRTATVSPPAPFSGSAGLRRDPNAVSPHLAGSLKLAFPGHTVGLTGPEVHVGIVHARQTKSRDGNGSISVSF
ncbi:MAG: hypothetical protein J0H06_13330 [Actinobacteria bacterium]|nr:hypothetical protein [Actinomycetota bacterium]